MIEMLEPSNLRYAPEWICDDLSFQPKSAEIHNRVSLKPEIFCENGVQLLRC